MNILVIAAHPDDEVLGCGGTIAAWYKKSKMFILPFSVQVHIPLDSGH